MSSLHIFLQQDFLEAVLENSSNFFVTMGEPKKSTLRQSPCFSVHSCCSGSSTLGKKKGEKLLIFQLIHIINSWLYQCSKNNTLPNNHSVIKQLVMTERQKYCPNPTHAARVIVPQLYAFIRALRLLACNWSNYVLHATGNRCLRLR